MKITDLNGKKVCILGYGKEGQAMLKTIQVHAPTAVVTIADKNQESRIMIHDSKFMIQLGKDYLKDLQRFDVIIKSPGIPHQPEFAAVEKKMTSSTQIFFDTIEGSGSLTIGITGSKGKSTTSSLIYQILKAAGKNVSLVGNIGEPSIGHIDEASTDKIFVIEMSSYQLESLRVSPNIALITALFDEHLDYHGTREKYRAAKQNIVRYQHPSDVVFYDALPHMLDFVSVSKAEKKIGYGSDDCPVKMEETQLLGRHNIWNMGGASAVARYLGVDEKTIIKTLKEFRALPHRLQNLGLHDGIYWVNDAISTTPESTILGIEALMQRTGSLMVGGQDRGNDFLELGLVIASLQNIEHVFLFPETGTRIRTAIEGHMKMLFREEKRQPLTLHDVKTMEEAVALAKKHTPKGTICLLSPASPSYNMYKNFEEKGDAFAECIRKEQ